MSQTCLYINHIKQALKYFCQFLEYIQIPIGLLSILILVFLIRLIRNVNLKALQIYFDLEDKNMIYKTYIEYGMDEIYII